MAINALGVKGSGREGGSWLMLGKTHRALVKELGNVIHKRTAHTSEPPTLVGLHTLISLTFYFFTIANGTVFKRRSDLLGYPGYSERP